MLQAGTWAAWIGVRLQTWVPPAATKGLRVPTNDPGAFFYTMGVMDYLILIFKLLYGLISLYKPPGFLHSEK